MEVERIIPKSNAILEISSSFSLCVASSTLFKGRQGLADFSNQPNTIQIILKQSSRKKKTWMATRRRRRKLVINKW